MLIKRFSVSDYIPLSFTGIKSLDAEYSQPIQIIIGSNGSGKSSLLREHSPLPTPKTVYGKNGVWSMEVSHGDKQYILESDFRRKHAHSFICNGEELNTSGTTQVQRDLVESHLGVTPFLWKLITCGNSFSTMSRNERKNLLIQANPTDLSFIVDKHKAIYKELNACRNNLKMLYSRKQDLKNQLLDKEILNERKKEWETLKDHLSALNRNSIVLEERISQLKSQISPEYNNFAQSLERSCRELKGEVRWMGEYSLSSKPEELREKLRRALYRNSLKMEQLDKSAQELREYLNKYSEYLKRIESSEKGKLETQIERTQKKIQLCAVDRDVSPIPENRIDEAIWFFEKVKEAVYNLSQIDYGKIINTSSYRAIKRKLDSLSATVRDWKGELEPLKREITSVEEEISAHKESRPPSDCSRTCGLLASYSGTLFNMTRRCSALKKRMRATEKKVDKYTRVLIQMSDSYMELRDPMTMYTSIVELFNTHYSSWVEIGNGELQEFLSSEPYRLVRRMEKIITGSTGYHEREKLQKEYNELVQKLKKFMDSDIPSKEALEKLYSECEERFNATYNEIMSREISKRAMERKLSDVERYMAIEQKIAATEEWGEKGIEDLKKRGEIDFYSKCKEEVDSALRSTQEKIWSIEKVLQEQSKLESRISEEIDVLIERAERRVAILSPLENALSPHVGIPNEYIANVLQTCIDNANYFIEQVWSYPLTILPIPKDRAVDFNFPVKIKGKKNKDISLCSSGQRDIIDMAFTLALMIHMGIIKDYPVFLDEPDKYADSHHRERILHFLSSLVEKGIVSQLFLINHHAHLHSGFSSSEVMCLSNENICVPDSYNIHCTMK